MKTVNLIDARDGAADGHVREREAEALAVRDACLGWLPLGGLLARLADPIVRAWMKRAGTAYAGAIDIASPRSRSSSISSEPAVLANKRNKRNK